jgi:hypothetical protein
MRSLFQRRTQFTQLVLGPLSDLPSISLKLRIFDLPRV